MPPRYSMLAQSRSIKSVLLVVLSILVSGGALAQAPATGNDVFIPRRSDGAHVTTATAGLCIGCSVGDDEGVVSDTLDAYATLRTTVSVGGSVSLAVTFPFDQPGGRHVGFALEDAAGLLDTQLLSTLTLRTYADGQLQETASGSALLTLGLINADHVRTVDMLANQPFDEIRITSTALASVATQTRLYYAYSSATPSPEVVLDGGLSIGGGLLGNCFGCSILNPGAILDIDLLNRVLLSVPGNATGSAYLDVALGTTHADPQTISFAIESTLSDAEIRSALSIRTFLLGVQQQTGSASALTIRTGTDGMRIVEFTATQTFDEVRVQLSALPGGISTLVKLAYFMVQPRPTATADTAPTTGTAELTAAYPNPMRDGAAFSLRLAQSENVRITLYDALGRQVAVLHDGTLPSGESSFRVNRSGLAGGVYVYRAEGSSFAISRRLAVTN